MEDVVQKFGALQKLKENNWIVNHQDSAKPSGPKIRSNPKVSFNNLVLKHFEQACILHSNLSQITFPIVYKYCVQQMPQARRNKVRSKDEEKKRREAARKRLAEARKAMATRVQDNSPAPDHQPIIDTAVTPESEQVAQKLSISASSDITTCQPMSKLDVVSCSMFAVPTKQEITSSETASTTSLVH